MSERQWFTNRRFTNQRQRQVPLTPMRVEGAKYYSYRPDALKTVSFASLAQVVTASTEPSDLRLGTTPFGEARVHLASFKLRTHAVVARAIKAHYLKTPEFIWVTDGRVNDKARTALAALQRADNFGLSSSDYQVDVPEDGLDAGDEAARQKRLIEFEMEVSAKVLREQLGDQAPTVDLRVPSRRRGKKLGADD